MVQALPPDVSLQSQLMMRFTVVEGYRGYLPVLSKEIRALCVLGHVETTLLHWTPLTRGLLNNRSLHPDICATYINTSLR